MEVGACSKVFLVEEEAQVGVEPTNSHHKMYFPNTILFHHLSPLNQTTKLNAVGRLALFGVLILV
jgi:hypothetical protein